MDIPGQNIGQIKTWSQRRTPQSYGEQSLDSERI